MAIRVGIFFGGPSREREISFAGGRTIYDNLNKALFEAIPIFVDSNKRYIVLDWQFIYKGSIRDFYPPVKYHPPNPNGFQYYIESLNIQDESVYNTLIEEVGNEIEPSQFKEYFDIAFLALHGYFGEDGILQSILESLEIPYTGSGIRPCSIGIDKSIQKRLMEKGGFSVPKMIEIDRKAWEGGWTEEKFLEIKEFIGTPLVIRPSNQGSSIGVSILEGDISYDSFERAVSKAFFIGTVDCNEWKSKNEEEKVLWVRELSDIRNSLGFPVLVAGEKWLFEPNELIRILDQYSLNMDLVHLQSYWSETSVLVESFIYGREFSCIVIRKEDDTICSLPPTEIIKSDKLYDYRSKYLPGLSRKQTPIDLDFEAIQKIREECGALFSYLGFHTYARIDGFYTEDGDIFLNDPNTTSGMLPSSFFFHQAAEIGLNPSEFLTYIIRVSLMEREKTTLTKYDIKSLIDSLDRKIISETSEYHKKRKIAVILGGYSFERHISVESGRNVFEKLSSSKEYQAIPIFLKKKDDFHELFQIPMDLLLKDNADDIADKIEHYTIHPVTAEIRQQCKDIQTKYLDKQIVFTPKKWTYESLKENVDGVFIALHGRPGEDGTIQNKLSALGIPYNGSDFLSSQITINKYETIQLLNKNGFPTTEQYLVSRSRYLSDPSQVLSEIQAQFEFPFIAKPLDDGCSSAVIKIKTSEMLQTYVNAIFREKESLGEDTRKKLGLKNTDEFPMKSSILIEELISSDGALKFMEITVGVLCHYDKNKIAYEVFEPSEALSGGEVLSLEEKFLAGEGQNITPARFAENDEEYKYIASQVKRDIEKACVILGVRGYARIDAFVRIFENNKVETIIIEVNSLPGMTPATCIFHQCAINGYKPYQFIDKILEFAFDEYKETV